MSVGETQAATNAALTALSSAEPVKQAMQVSLLKKALEQQKAEAATLMQMVEGKGRVIDIRV